MAEGTAPIHSPTPEGAGVLCTLRPNCMCEHGVFPIPLSSQHVVLSLTECLPPTPHVLPWSFPGYSGCSLTVVSVLALMSVCTCARTWGRFLQVGSRGQRALTLATNDRSDRSPPAEPGPVSRLGDRPSSERGGGWL